MASQQILFAETVASIKKALKRKAYESDSDESIDHNGNRGQKLKKRARFTRRGQLAPATAPQVYKEEIEYAGVKRRIVDRNPPLVDSDGFEVDSEDDERVQAALENVADLNPYSSIRLERILAPLTSVTDLPSHPTLSMPFTAKTLTELSHQASELMRREHASLWKARKLMTSLCGDFTWASCGTFVGPNDIDLYNDENPSQRQRKKRPLLAETGSSPITNGNKITTVNGASSGAIGAPADSTGEKVPGGEDVAMVDGPNGDSQPPGGANEGKATAQPTLDGQQVNAASDKNPEPEASAAAEVSSRQQLGDTTRKATSPDQDGKDGTALQRSENKGEAQGAEQAGVHVTEMMGQGANGDLQHTDSSDDVFIHPFFNPPANRLPDRDMGLPASEAENVRHLMSLYVQKQEEICRGMTKLHHGLLKADRLRAAVFHWTKAEAHVGELSDGEDWYDREEWELSDDLLKGQDEEDEETNTTTTQSTKKTRNRRA